MPGQMHLGRIQQLRPGQHVEKIHRHGQFNDDWSIRNSPFRCAELAEVRHAGPKCSFEPSPGPTHCISINNLGSSIREGGIPW